MAETRDLLADLLASIDAAIARRPVQRYSRSIFGPYELFGTYSPDDQRKNYGASSEDCDQCNYVRHRCGACGEELNHDGTEATQYGPERLHPDCWEG